MLRFFAVALVSLLVVLASSGAMISAAFDREPPMLAHYVVENGGSGFILDRTGDMPRLKFDNSEEIFVLRMLPAAGGDRLLQRDDGAIVLRIAFLGGITFFPPGNPRGVPVAPDRRPVQRLDPRPPNFRIVRDVAGRIEAQLRAETGRDIAIVAEWQRAAQDEFFRLMLFDSIRNAGSATLNMIRAGGRAGIANNLREVRFLLGGAPGAYRQGNTLIVVFAFGQGLAGRPSSYLIGSQVRQFVL